MDSKFVAFIVLMVGLLGAYRFIPQSTIESVDAARPVQHVQSVQHTQPVQPVKSVQSPRRVGQPPRRVGQSAATNKATQLTWGTQTCGPNAVLTTLGDYQICLPSTTCTAETCPPTLGTCSSNGVTCTFNNGYQGIATYPHAMSTYYCDLSAGGCHGVTQNNFPEVNAATIASNFGLQICEQSNATTTTCIGIAASSPMVVGNSQEATNSAGTLVTMWGQGMTEYTGVCYKLTGPTGNTAIVALTDRCGGYCSCNGGGVEECGPCVNAVTMKPNCPCVGTDPGLYSQCCGLTEYGCAVTNDQCDWCSANNHPHFDLDTGTYNFLAGSGGELGSIDLLAVSPVTCMTPLNWPPGSGGSSTSGSYYIPCPTNPPSFDTGVLGPGTGCNSGLYLVPGSPLWVGSASSNHWCCVESTTTGTTSMTTISTTTSTTVGSTTAGTTSTTAGSTTGGSTPITTTGVSTTSAISTTTGTTTGAYIPCPNNTWDCGYLGPDPGCSSNKYLKPGNSQWVGSQNANHWCCVE